MIRSYWGEVHRQAFAEAAKALHLESRVKVLVGALGLIVALVCLAFWGSSHATADEAIIRIAIAGTLLCLFPFVYFWKLVSIPARMDAEAKAARASTPSPIVVFPRIHCDSKRLIDDSNQQQSTKQGLWENIFYLVLQNSQPNRTIRNVSVYIHTIDSIERCLVRGVDAFASDVRHGDFVFYRLGRVISTEFTGLPQAPGTPITMEQMKSYLHNAPQGFLSFEPGGGWPSVKFAGGGLGDTPRGTWTFPVVITADDLPGITVAVAFDLSSQKVIATLAEALPPGGVSFDSGDFGNVVSFGVGLGRR